MKNYQAERTVTDQTGLPVDRIKNFISTLMVAVSNCSLYSKEHGAFDKLARETFSVLSRILGERLAIMIVDNELIINRTHLKEAGLHGVNLKKRLKMKKISRVDFLEGLSLSEIKQFIIDISKTDKSLKKYSHIKTGNVDVAFAGPKRDFGCDTGSLSSVSSEEIAKVKDVFHSASPFRKLNVAGLEEVVLHFISNFKREASILKYLSPVKSFSEYTYTHATNVAVLSVFQAETMGIGNELLHEVGMAALLHDAGKLFITKEILEKKGALDDREFAEIKKHPLRGAAYLAKMDDLTPLASILAFEHHKKYDGTGYPDIHLNGHRQHVFSQIVAIADFFDALRSKRPYRGSMEIKEILVLMKKSAGKDFNPFLLDNFISSLKTALN